MNPKSLGSFSRPTFLRPLLLIVLVLVILLCAGLSLWTGWYALIFGPVYLVILVVHSLLHARIIFRTSDFKPPLLATVLFSHLFLVISFLLQPSASDYGSSLVIISIFIPSNTPHPPTWLTVNLMLILQLFIPSLTCGVILLLNPWRTAIGTIRRPGIRNEGRVGLVLMCGALGLFALVSTYALLAISYRPLLDPVASIVIGTPTPRPKPQNSTAVSSAKYSRDGKRILTASMDDTLRVWDATIGKQLLLISTSHLGKADFSPDGNKILSFDGEAARTWDALTGKTLLSLRQDDMELAQFSPDGKQILTGSRNQSALIIWDATSGRQIQRIPINGTDIEDANYSPDGKYIAAAKAGMGVGVYVWDASTGKQLAQLSGHSDFVSTVLYSPDGKHIVTASEDKTARIWDGASMRLLYVLEGHTSGISSVCFSPDGNRVATTSLDQTARIWDIATGKELLVLKGHTWSVLRCAYSADGKQILTSGDEGSARLWDAETGRQIGGLGDTLASMRSIAYSPDGKQILTAHLDGTARVWDAATGRELLVLQMR